MAVNAHGITLQAEMQGLRETLAMLLEEKKKMAKRLDGLKHLANQLHQKEEESKKLTEKNERLEGSLARAENRISQLSLLARNGDGKATASGGAIVTPGVSKKVLEAMTRENTTLKQAFDHASRNGLHGADLIVENRHLHGIIARLRDERDGKQKQVDEMKTSLAAIEDPNTEALREQVARLTEQARKAERNLNIKQVFCETIVTENETLKKKLETLQDENIVTMREMKKTIGDAAQKQSDLREMLDRAWDEEAKKTQELEGEIEKLVAELRDAKQDRDRLRDQLDELQKSVDTVTREREDLAVRFKEVKIEHGLMQAALRGYEDDFKKEREEKRKVLRDRDKLREERNRLQTDHRTLRQKIGNIHSPSNKDDEPEDPFADEAPNPNPRILPGSRWELLECPDCNKKFPLFLYEDHVRSCSE